MDNIKIFSAKYLFAAVVLIVVWVWFRQTKDKKKEMLASALIAGVLALIVSRIAGKLYYDPRPFVTQHIQPLIPHAADNGFPSDHALLTSTLSAVIYAFSKKWGILAFILTIIVGAGRVLVHIHSPIDIAGAWLIGIGSALIGLFLAAKYFKASPAAKPDGQKDDQ